MWLRQQYWGWEKLLSTVALSAENTPSYIFPFLENWGWLQTKPCRISWQHAIWQTSKIHALLFKFNVRKLIWFPVPYVFSEQRLKSICLPCDEEWKCWMKEIIVWHDNGILSRCISALDAVCITGKRNLPVRTSNVSWHCFPRQDDSRKCEVSKFLAWSTISIASTSSGWWTTPRESFGSLVQ